MLRCIIGLVLVAAAVAATASAQDVKLPEIEFGRYHALVIGNNDYEHLRNLTTAVGDAEAVAKLLEDKYGFNVTKLTNATRRDITEALNGFRQTLTEKGDLLNTDLFSNARLTNYLKAISAHRVMVVADSCYLGNLVRVATSTVRLGAERIAWMERMNQKRSRTALTTGRQHAEGRGDRAGIDADKLTSMSYLLLSSAQKSARLNQRKIAATNGSKPPNSEQRGNVGIHVRD